MMETLLVIYSIIFITARTARQVSIQKCFRMQVHDDYGNKTKPINQDFRLVDIQIMVMVDQQLFKSGQQVERTF